MVWDGIQGSKKSGFFWYGGSVCATVVAMVRGAVVTRATLVLVRTEYLIVVCGGNTVKKKGNTSFWNLYVSNNVNITQEFNFFF